MNGPDCIFCRIAAGEIPARQIYADDHAIAFLDQAPMHPGHSLVIPREHRVDALDGAGALADVAPAIEQTGALLRTRLRADGVNVFTSVGEVAGQVVFHLHVHVVPRYADNPGLSRLITRSEPADDGELDAIWEQVRADR